MEYSTYLRFLLALLFVLGLIAALAWAARRFGFGGGLPIPGRAHRLSVVEPVTLDAKRRLVLVRRDDREHLLVLGPSGETVIESGLSAATAPAGTPAAAKVGAAS